MYTHQQVRDLAKINKELIQALTYTTFDFKSVMYRTKGDKGQEFGYYVSDNEMLLPSILKALGAKSFIDLGCGLGLIPIQLQILLPTIKTGGVDNEKGLLDIARHLHRGGTTEFIQDDLLTSKFSYIADYDVMYFWTPIADHELMKKFVAKLTSKLKKGQIIISYSNNMPEELESEFSTSPKLKYHSSRYNRFQLAINESYSNFHCYVKK